MNTSVIITKKAGEVPLRGYIQAALAACPTCYGIAIQDTGDSGPILDVMSSTSMPTIDKMMETLTAIKEVQAVITLGNMKQDFDVDTDLMPYVFQQTGEDGELQDILAIFIEGDAPNYTKVGEGHIEAYNLWENFIFPTLLEKFEASVDLPSFYAKLRTSTFEQMMLNVFSHRGVVTFVPLEGDIISYGKNEAGAEFPWGTTSNTFQWTGAETFKEKASAVVVKAKSRLAAITGGTTKEVATAGQTTTIETDANGTHHLKGVKTETAVKAPEPAPAAAPEGTTPMKPPSKLQGNARNAWIRLFTGVNEGPMPVGHSHADFVVNVPNNLVEFATKDVSTKDHVKNLGKEVTRAKSKAAPDAIAKAHDEAVKINEAKPTVQDPKKVEEKLQPIDYLPDTSAEERKKATDLVTEWATLPKRPSVLDVQRIESKWDKFSAKHGIQFKDMLGWTIAERKRICREIPNEAAIAMGEMAMWCLDHGAIDPAVQVPAAPAPDKQVEVPPVAQPVAQPAPAAKKSRLAAITGKAA